MFRMIGFLVFVALLSYRVEGQRSTPCERYGFENWTHVGPQKTCYIKLTTVISQPDVSISASREMTNGLSLWGNTKIAYLPTRVAESFPNLLVYGAAGCSVKTISKQNFLGLRRVRRLDISNNQIVSVPIDTFSDMTALEWLQLGSNKISSMSGDTFNNLNALEKIVLTENVCINEEFLDSARITIVKSVVNQKCAADFSSRVGDNAEIQSLNAQLIAANEAKMKCYNLINVITDVARQLNKRGDSMNHNYNQGNSMNHNHNHGDPMNSYHQNRGDTVSVGELLVDLQNKKRDIAEKDEKIRALELKLKRFEG